jgi:hypothetical protein
MGKEVPLEKHMDAHRMDEWAEQKRLREKGFTGPLFNGSDAALVPPASLASSFDGRSP